MKCAQCKTTKKLYNAGNFAVCAQCAWDEAVLNGVKYMTVLDLLEAKNDLIDTLYRQIYQYEAAAVEKDQLLDFYARAEISKEGSRN